MNQLRRNTLTHARKLQQFHLASSVHTIDSIKKVGVVGLGLMGHGIVQVSAQAGYQVIAIESNDKALAVGKERIVGSLSKFIARDVKKGKVTEEAGKAEFEKVMQRITTTTDLSTAKDCDLIIEAIAENMDLKLGFYDNLRTIMKPEAIFASNTSSLPITGMAVKSQRPEKFVGLHFFNPVQLMRLVEVIKTESTSSDVYDTMTEFVKKIGKTPVQCGDTPGFIVNRLLVPLMGNAMQMVDRQVASVPDIDVSMQLGAGHPMGPLHLADYVGLDTCLSILNGWKEAYPEEPSFVVPKILEKLNAAGHFGRKSGRGFYHWDGDKVGAPAEL